MEVIEKDGIPACPCTFVIIIFILMFYRWRKAVDNRKTLMERSDIRELRSTFIRKVTNHRAQGRTIVYTGKWHICKLIAML